jgi:Na+/melibiose symporter-like transporter
MNTSTNTKKASGLGVICYGLGDLASQFIWTFVGSYLTIRPEISE